MPVNRARIAAWVGARMNCTGTLVRPHEVDIDAAPVDPVTRRPDPAPTPTTIYTGKASIGPIRSRGSTTIVGDREAVEVPVTLGFPVGTDAQLGDVFTVTAVDDDADDPFIDTSYRIERVRESSRRVRVATEASEYRT
jgi:hypothetical protein